MRLTIERSIWIFAVAVLSGLTMAMLVLGFAYEKSRIESPQYYDIMRGKQLVSDILPPSLNVIEAYLTAYEIRKNLENFDPVKLQAKLAKLEALRKSYYGRLDFWEKSELPDDIKAFVKTDLRSTGDSFWSKMDDFLKAAKTGEQFKGQAAFSQVLRSYEHQFSVVQKLEQISTTFLSQTEAHAHSQGVLYSTIAYSTAAVVFAVFCVGVWALRGRAVVPMKHLSASMNELAKGNYSIEIPHLKRNDEVGDMARSVSVLRDAGLDKLRLEAENQRQREAAEADRSENILRQEIYAANLAKVVAELGSGLERLSSFDVQSTLDEPFAPEYEMLRRDFNKSLAIYRDTMEQILANVRDIDASAATLGSSSDQISKRVERQASALEETAATLEQITSNVQSSSARTKTTRARAADTKGKVAKSGEIVESAISAMGRIQEASTRIGNITNVIDEIAFQTNLLALNAGVEAARAGETGKGFAVVAQEVRELAQRSAAAAKDIKDLIARSGREVAEGVELVARTGSALREIEDGIIGIATEIEAIAQSSQEQSSGLTAINSAVNQMDQITQQNAAMAEETSAATHDLADQVVALVRLVSQFVVNNAARQSSGQSYRGDVSRAA